MADITYADLINEWHRGYDTGKEESSKALAAKEAEIARLTERVKELEAWKEAAIDEGHEYLACSICGHKDGKPCKEDDCREGFNRYIGQKAKEVTPC